MCLALRGSSLARCLSLSSRASPEYALLEEERERGEGEREGEREKGEGEEETYS